MASLETRDQQTNRSYLESGFQPFVGGVTPIRNVQVFNKKDPHERRGGDQTRKAASASMQVAGTSMQVAGKGVSLAGSVATRAGVALSSTGVGAVVGVPLAAAGTAASVSGKMINTTGKTVSRAGKNVHQTKNVVKGLAAGKDIAAKMKATTVTTSIWAWNIPAWLFFQLPLALLSLVFLLSAVLVDEITKLVAAEEDDGLLVSALKTAVGAVGDFVSWVIGGVGAVLEGIFGFDPTTVDFTGFFVALWLIVMLFGFFILLVIYLIYTISLLHPLSGTGSGTKYSALLIAIIGYSIPLLNLFPWFIFWTLAIWRYPK